jgi:nucleotide-binding universal stress UspA family protein
MKRFKNILYVNDSTDDQAWAIARAVSLAENKQADLTVVDVIPIEVVTAGVGLPPGGPISTDFKAAVVADHYEQLGTLVKSYKQRLSIQLEVLVGNTALEVIRSVMKNAYDLVIKPAENPNWLERLFGINDMHLLRLCPCPVWLMKPGDNSNYNSILAAVDFDPPNPLTSDRSLNREILERAVSLALSNFAELHIVHAWHATGESAMRGILMHVQEENRIRYVETVRRQHAANLDALMGEIANNLGQEVMDYLKPQAHLVKGTACKEIPALAKRIEANLIVMGTVGRTGVHGFIMGNTAETILNQINCSVLAIKPPGFVTPVTLEG